MCQTIKPYFVEQVNVNYDRLPFLLSFMVINQTTLNNLTENQMDYVRVVEYNNCGKLIIASA